MIQKLKTEILIKKLNTFKQLSVSLCSAMLFTLLKRPWLMWPTIQATLQTTISSEKYFEESHFGEGIANAYKHALWNILIAHNSRFWFKSPENRVAWAKRITDLHEKCFPNEEASMQMDLNNNKIGRNLYLKYFSTIKNVDEWEAIVLNFKEKLSILE